MSQGVGEPVVVLGHDLPGQVAKAGLISELHAAPCGVAGLRSPSP